MKAGKSVPPERAGAPRHGLRLRARRAARHAALPLAREPEAGVVGALLTATAAPVLAYLLARPGIVPAQAWLCQETAAVLLAGVLLLGAARVRAWRR